MVYVSNLAEARHNMIVQQIRPWDVLDMRVLELFEEVFREDFVPSAHKNLAYCDLELPLGNGQAMMPPKVEARMLQALDPQPTEVALEIGTGSGYVTALLSRLAARVDSLELYPELKARADALLQKFHFENIRTELADVFSWQPQGRYDVIAVTGSMPIYNGEFDDWLEVGGRLFVIVGKAPVMRATLITRTAEDEWHREVLFETVSPPLVNAPSADRFEF